MTTKKNQSGEGQETMAEESAAQATRERKEARRRRAEEVRRKYDFGVIRALRQQRNLTIEQFAKICGLSYAPISRIETNLIKPNLETLDKIAAGLGISTYSLVAMAERREALTQKAREYRFGGFFFQMLSFDDLAIYFGEGPAGAVAENPDLHPKDFATLAVRRGLLEVRLNEKVFSLGQGEAISFDCVFPHKYTALKDVEFVLVTHAQH